MNADACLDQSGVPSWRLGLVVAALLIANLGSVVGAQEGNAGQVDKAITPVDKAIAAVEKAGGTVVRNEGTPGKPVVSVNLQNRGADDGLLATLTPLTSLRELDLGSCDGVTDNGLAHLKGLTKLQKVDLSGTRVSLTGLARLKGLTELQSLDLHANSFGLSNGELALNPFKKLQTLDLSRDRGQGSQTPVRQRTDSTPDPEPGRRADQRRQPGESRRADRPHRPQYRS